MSTAKTSIADRDFIEFRKSCLESAIRTRREAASFLRAHLAVATMATSQRKPSEDICFVAGRYIRQWKRDLQKLHTEQRNLKKRLAYTKKNSPPIPPIR